jgi:hypothetical protein
MPISEQHSLCRFAKDSRDFCWNVLISTSVYVPDLTCGVVDGCLALRFVATNSVCIESQLNGSTCCLSIQAPILLRHHRSCLDHLTCCFHSTYQSILAHAFYMNEQNASDSSSEFLLRARSPCSVLLPLMDVSLCLSSMMSYILVTSTPGL